MISIRCGFLSLLFLLFPHFPQVATAQGDPLEGRPNGPSGKYRYEMCPKCTYCCSIFAVVCALCGFIFQISPDHPDPAMI